jgi:hypothetical protein
VARAKSAKSKIKRNPTLTYLLTFVLIFEVLLSVWAFVHFGAGTSRISVDRFQPFGAEILMAITAATAGFAWFTIFRKRWAAYGLFTGLGLSLLWIWASPINTDGLKGPGTVEAFPSWPVPSVVAITLIAGLGLLFLVSQEWRGFDRQ